MHINAFLFLFCLIFTFYKINNKNDIKFVFIMRFPKELSAERLSLLSPEERAIYEQEHIQKPYKNNIIQESGIEELFKDNPIEFEEIDYDTAKEIYDSVCEDTMSDITDKNDELYSDFTNDIYENLCKDNLIFEGAEGWDAGYWIQGFFPKWFGPLIGAGLAGLGTGIYGLLVLGKDKIAIAKLKNYMNQIVEIVDQGILKRRPWYSFFIPFKSKRNFVGEYNFGCLRSIQEMADRAMCNGCMQAAHKLGFFATGNMMSISNADQPQIGSGLDEFKENVIGQLNVVIED